MADELDVLLEKVADPGLRAELRAAVDKVRAKRSFGLVFESHLPERVRLPEYPVRRGTKVVRRADKNSGPTKVEGVRRGQAIVVTDDGTRDTVPVDDLVVVAEFGEPVYPGLTSVGSIRRGGDKPAHVVINAENHHALEMLQFTHAGKVDCIYIDPPYNTGAERLEVRQQLRRWRRCVPPQQVAGVHGASAAPGEAAAQPRRLRAHRDDRREGVPAAWSAAAADVSECTDVQMVTIVINRAGWPRPELGFVAGR